jgi:hypothetical protein
MEIFMSELIYLASVYSQGNASANKKTRRYKAACKKAAELMMKGYKVFAPIAHSHPIEVFGLTEAIEEGFAADHDFWLAQDEAILAKCDKLVVYKMPGWKKSVGIAREMAFAKEHNIPIEFID